MISRVIETNDDRATAVKWLESHPLPFTLSIIKGKRRTNAQNKLQRLWMNEIAEQLGEGTPEDYRAWCKLHFGVAIRKAEDDEYAEAYDLYIRPKDYEEKLRLMAIPWDVAVTRDMTTKQKTQYLDEIYRHFTEHGVLLTRPEGM